MSAPNCVSGVMKDGDGGFFWIDLVRLYQREDET